MPAPPIASRSLTAAALALVALLAAPSGAFAADGDFNGDGFEDLAVGTPVQQLGPDLEAGVVHVVYGSATGLQLVDDFNDQLSEDTLPGQASGAGELFGDALAAGDFNGDGFDDLAVGASRELVDTGEGPFFAGAVFVYLGSADGIDREAAARFDQETPGIGGTTQEDPEKFGDGELFGAALATGRVDAGPRDDLVIGVPGDAVGSLEDAGAMHVLYGGGNGPKAQGSDYVHEDSPGALGRAAENERFARSVAAGDLGGGGRHEVAARSRTGLGEGEGAVHVFGSEAEGLSTAGDQIITRVTPGIAGPTGPDFGTVLLADDLGHDEHDDLIVGAPGEIVGAFDSAGALNVIYGSEDGLSTRGDQFLTQDKEGVSGVIGQEDLFGRALAVGRFDAGPSPDLAVGAPLDAEPVSNHGAALVFYGGERALAIEGNEFFNQDDPLDGDLLGGADPNDFFGQELAAGRFSGPGRDALAVGVPGDTVGAVDGAGAVTLLLGSGGGLTATGQQLFSQSQLFGAPAENERFGSSLTASSSGTGWF